MLWGQLERVSAIMKTYFLDFRLRQVEELLLRRADGRKASGYRELLVVPELILSRDKSAKDYSDQLDSHAMLNPLPVIGGAKEASIALIYDDEGSDDNNFVYDVATLFGATWAISTHRPLHLVSRTYPLDRGSILRFLRNYGLEPPQGLHVSYAAADLTSGPISTHLDDLFLMSSRASLSATLRTIPSSRIAYLTLPIQTNADSSDESLDDDFSNIYQDLMAVLVVYKTEPSGEPDDSDRNPSNDLELASASREADQAESTKDGNVVAVHLFDLDQVSTRQSNVQEVSDALRRMTKRSANG